MYKRITSTLVALTLVLTTMGQASPEANAKTIMTAADNTKSMNRQEAVTNFMQAVANNLTNNAKSVQLKASIFALNPLDSATKYSSKYYLDHTWERHTQIILGGGLDANSNFNAVSAGFSYDLLHNNDASEVRTFDKDMKTLYLQIAHIEDGKVQRLQYKLRNDLSISLKDMMVNLNEGIGQAEFNRALLEKLIPAGKRDSVAKHDRYFQDKFRAVSEAMIEARRSGELNKLSIDSGSAIYNMADYVSSQYFATPLGVDFYSYLTYITNNGKEPPAPTDIDSSMFNGFIADVNQEFSQNVALLHGKNLVDVYNYIQQEYKKHLNRIKLRPLLTLGYNYTYNAGITQNQHIPTLSFLYGFCDPDRPVQVSFTFADSLTTDTTHLTSNNNLMAFQPGISKVFAIDANAASLFEAGFTLEFDHCTSSLYTGQKRDNLLPTLTFQARPTAKSPWIKLVVKRDGNKANFLGFLNVTFNLDNSAGSSN